MSGVRKVVDGATFHLAQQAEHCGVTAGAALDAALEVAMDMLVDDNQLNEFQSKIYDPASAISEEFLRE